MLLHMMYFMPSTCSTCAAHHACRYGAVLNESACNPNPILCLAFRSKHAYYGDVILQSSPSEADSANEGALRRICAATHSKWSSFFSQLREPTSKLSQPWPPLPLYLLPVHSRHTHINFHGIQGTPLFPHFSLILKGKAHWGVRFE